MGCGVVERHLEMAQPTKKQKKTPLSSLIEGDESCIGPSGKLLCL